MRATTPEATPLEGRVPTHRSVSARPPDRRIAGSSDRRGGDEGTSERDRRQRQPRAVPHRRPGAFPTAALVIGVAPRSPKGPLVFGANVAEPPLTPTNSDVQIFRHAG